MNLRTARAMRIVLAMMLIFSIFLPTALADFKLGDKAAQVMTAKKALKSAGYYSGFVNKTFDKALKSAVTVFQRANSIDETGTLDDLTLKRLETKSYMTYTQYEDKLKDQVLRQGGTGKYVTALQKRLIKLKYLSGKPGGVYDAATASAVKLYQSYAGLKETGVADKATRDKLNSKTARSKKQYEADKTKTLKKGNSGDAVKTLQSQLAQLGYYTGQVNGKYEKSTVSAVSAFQTANGIKVSGIANTVTRTKLNAGSGVSKAAYEESLKTRALKYKDKGEAVKVLQTRLAELGYYEKKVNGKYDTDTKKAVAKFQTYNGLASNGTANAETRKAMNLSTARKVSDVEGAKPLKKGMTGDAVKSAQARLKELGFFSGTVNGKFLSDTETAAKNFQTANDLTKTGILSSSDQTLLFSSKAVSKAGYEEKLRLKRVEQVIALAMEQIDKPYVWASAGPDSFDCTGLTRYCYKSVGITLKRSAYEQGYKDGKRIESAKDVRRGDIVVFNTVEDGENDLADHVGIYLGNGQFIHASSAAAKVMISNMASGYYSRVFSWGLNVW